MWTLQISERCVNNGISGPEYSHYTFFTNFIRQGHHPRTSSEMNGPYGSSDVRSVVALNGGTTTVEVARAIATSEALHSGVTVVTNALNIATELTVRPFIKIVVCGGVARPQSYELVGSLAGDTMGQLTSDICFLGATGVDAAGGITITDEAEAPVNRVMVTQAKRSYVVADASKLGEVGFFRICQLAEVTGLITDDAADPALLNAIRDTGIEVILA